MNKKGFTLIELIIVIAIIGIFVAIAVPFFTSNNEKKVDVQIKLEQRDDQKNHYHPPF